MECIHQKTKKYNVLYLLKDFNVTIKISCNFCKLCATKMFTSFIKANQYNNKQKALCFFKSAGTLKYKIVSTRHVKSTISSIKHKHKTLVVPELIIPHLGSYSKSYFNIFSDYADENGWINENMNISIFIKDVIRQQSKIHDMILDDSGTVDYVFTIDTFKECFQPRL